MPVRGAGGGQRPSGPAAHLPAGSISEKVKERALAEGFAAVGITRPAAVPEIAGRLAAFVDNGWHGDMGWMAERMPWRGNPAALWPEARSIVMLAETYTPTEDPRHLQSLPDRGAISVYARNRDYHDVVKKRLKRLGRWLIEATGPDTEIKVFVDTAPVMEKPLAAAAGVGWQGKHTNLLSRELGNWFFLGAIFTTLELEEDAPGEDYCGSCTACLDACPTRAFPAPGQLDARAMFRRNPIKRIGRARFLRNVCYAIGNSGNSGLAAAVRPLADDPDPVLADAARWAVARLE